MEPEQIKITGGSCYVSIQAMMPIMSAENEKIIDIRARLCTSCKNFMQLALACGKCGCQKQAEFVSNPGQFIREKLFDLGYHCELGYW